jgi:hypothetical protein
MVVARQETLMVPVAAAVLLLLALPAHQTVMEELAQHQA